MSIAAKYWEKKYLKRRCSDSIAEYFLGKKNWERIKKNKKKNEKSKRKKRVDTCQVEESEWKKTLILIFMLNKIKIKVRIFFLQSSKNG